MKKPDLGQTISILANIGVLIGILLLAYELRQNTEAIQATTIQSIADQSIQSNLAGVHIPELRAAYRRTAQGVDYATQDDWDILMWWYSTNLRVMENRFRQVGLGTLSSDGMEQVGGRATGYSHPMFGEIWEWAMDGYAPDFAAWVEENLIPYVQDSRPLPEYPETSPNEESVQP